MGEPAVPSFAERQAALKLARETIEAVHNDEHSLMSELHDCYAGLEDGDEIVHSIFVMMQMLVENADATSNP